MKKTLSFLVTLTFMLCLIPISASSALQSGDPCQSKGEITANGRYQCRSVGNSLKWVVRFPSESAQNTKTQQSRKRFVIPNFVGLQVQYLRTHRNNFPGVQFFITGSSCAVSDLLSGDAQIIGQSRSPGTSGMGTGIVTLYTNC